MQKREYGKKGDRLSIIGFGGIIVMNEEQKVADAFVAEAIDRGVNYFDVAPTYGNAEEKLGPALRGKRSDIFLACKTVKRRNVESEKELYNSLKLLKTDHFDLYQIHGVTSMEEVDTILGPDGCLESFIKAKEKGIIRHIGFSVHSEEAAIALMQQYEFDSVLFPLNCVNINNSGFGIKILEESIKKGISRLALKAMAWTNWSEGEKIKYEKCWYKPIDELELAKLAVRFTLSKDITASISPGHMELFQMAADICENFKPLSPEEDALLKERCRGIKPIF